MNLKRFTFLLSLFLVTGFSAFSQTDSIPLVTLAQKTAEYNNSYPVEKVYLHFDKPYYAVGDTIWFKAYVTADSYSDLKQRVPSAISNVVYVDVIGKDTIVQKFKLAVTKGVAFGNIAITKAQYRQGNYQIRAYTKWMRNFDAAYFFDKTLSIGDAINKKILTNISITSSTQNNTAKVLVRINYRNPDGSAIAGKKVNWRVQTKNDEVLSKSKETTDANGNITVSFTTNKLADLPTSDLFTEIDASPKEITTQFSLKNTAAAMDVQFFPEGGDLIEGVAGKVAFKAVAPNGMGADIKGIITDNTGATVVNFSSQHLGMGTFSLTPAAGKTYKAAVTFADGSKNTYDLPKVSAQDITISIVSVSPQRLVLNLLCNDAYLQKNKGKRFYIIAQNGQAVFYAAQTGALGATTFPLSITNKLPSGVAKISVLSSNGDALSERLVFINKKDDQLLLSLNTAKPVYTSRDNVVMNVSAKNADKPVAADLSVTVIDEAKVPYDESDETTILTHLLLTSDLKGYIEKPNYYFNAPTDKTNADLDALMLTQGYSRIVYKNIAANKLPPNVKFQPEDGITISGTLRTSVGLPVNRGNVNLEIKDRRMSVNTQANTVGEFAFSKLYFPDSLQAVVSAKGNVNSSNFMIILNKDSFQPITASVNAPAAFVNIDSAMRPYLLNSKKMADNSRVLSEVTIRANVAPKVKKASHSDNSALTGLPMMASRTIDGAMFAACATLFDCLQGQGGLNFDQQTQTLTLTRNQTQGDNRPVAIYLNNFMVDFSTLRTIDPKTVESVEVFLNDGVSSINRMTGTTGVVVINSKKVENAKMSKDQIAAVLDDFMPANSGVKIKPQGFSAARTFYSPRYDVSKDTYVGGDLRTTIYWNPRVNTDPTTGAATFDFFNADGKGSYKAIIEGFDADGNIGRSIYRYKVE
ncbi:Ig-like domain-containing protein [Mucilaginibacter calamicampi]|uniref:Ig-like domain-containing protein n=1 Tax=Mucilaginibacter calamicampi TaxID=1302352 RepID=A0ABW2YU95_9SPHI